LLIFAILLLSLGIHCSHIPGPNIAGAFPSIILGAFICFVTIVGGLAFKLHQIELNIIYLIFLVCIFGAQLIFATATLLMDERFMVRSFLKEMYNTKVPRLSGDIEEFQNYFQCCGFYGPDGSDVIVTEGIYLSKGNEKPTLRNVTHLIPECCPRHTVLCTKLDSYKDNCVDKIVKEHSKWRKMLGAFLVSSAYVLAVVFFLGVKEISISQ
ncbi:hypothetical protein YQE_04379, partial [Dendroctonus ponderosae]